MEEYSRLADEIEAKLDGADMQAENRDIGLSHDEVFSRLRRKLNEQEV